MKNYSLADNSHVLHLQTLVLLTCCCFLFNDGYIGHVFVDLVKIQENMELI